MKKKKPQQWGELCLWKDQCKFVAVYGLTESFINRPPKEFYRLRPDCYRKYYTIDIPYEDWFLLDLNMFDPAGLTKANRVVLEKFGTKIGVCKECTQERIHRKRALHLSWDVSATAEERIEIELESRG